MLRRAVWGPAVAGGALGPLIWTCAWLVAGLLQPGYDVRRDYISGLAAVTAQTPSIMIMIVGFLAGGGGILLFAIGLFRATGPGVGARSGAILLAVVGAGIIAAGLFRTDCSDIATVCVLRDRLGETSWHSHVHDLLASGYVLFALPPLLLARRVAPGGPARRWLRAAAIVVAMITVTFAALFRWHELAGWSGLSQRIFVTAPFAWVEAVALWLWWVNGPARSAAARRGVRSTSGAAATRPDSALVPGRESLA